jgi:lysophospholipase L1-like esterase
MALRSKNLSPFSVAVKAGSARHIVAVGDSINSDDTNNRMGEGRWKRWDVGWVGWTFTGANTSSWGGTINIPSVSGLTHTDYATPASGGTVSLGNGESNVHPRYVHALSFSSNIGDYSAVLYRIMTPSENMQTAFRGDPFVGKEVVARMVYRNDASNGVILHYHGNLVIPATFPGGSNIGDGVDIGHSGGNAWTYAEKNLGTLPSNYVRISLEVHPTGFTSSGIGGGSGYNETGKTFHTLCQHVKVNGVSGPQYTPLGIAGWKSSDWLDTARLSDANLRSMLAAIGNPNTLLLEIGANDAASSVAKATYKANVIAIIERFYAAFTANGGTGADFMVVLEAPYDLGTTRTAFLADYAEALEEIATSGTTNVAASKIGTLNLFRIMEEANGPWADWQATQLGDGVHPSATGILTFADLEWAEIDSPTPPTPTASPEAARALRPTRMYRLRR